MVIETVSPVWGYEERLGFSAEDQFGYDVVEGSCGHIFDCDPHDKVPSCSVCNEHICRTCLSLNNGCCEDCNAEFVG